MAKRDPVVIQLEEPITFGSETITEMTVKPPKAKHLRGLSAQPDFGEMLDLAGRLCDQVKTVMDELVVADAVKILEAVENFMPAGLTDGNL